MRLFPKSRTRRAAVVVVLLGYTLLMLSGRCADYFILYPSTQRYVIPGTTRREVAVPDAKPVEVWTAGRRGLLPGSRRRMCWSSSATPPAPRTWRRWWPASGAAGRWKCGR